MECKLEINQSKCNCTYEPCPRKGRCCDCISYHLKMDELPACAFSREVERTYDRSFARFVRAYQERSGGKR
jgi:hypothetical protein